MFIADRDFGTPSERRDLKKAPRAAAPRVAVPLLSSWGIRKRILELPSGYLT